MKIALVGDSHALPLFRRLKKAMPGVQVVFEAQKNGASLKAFQKLGVLDQVAAARPDVLFLSVGGNNQDLSRQTYGRFVAEQLAKLRRAGIRKIFWNGPATSDASVAPSTARRHEWTATFLRSFLPGKGVVFFDARPVTLQGQRGDGVHFDRQGYDRWAAAVGTSFGRFRAAMANKPAVASAPTGKWLLLGLAAVAGFYFL